MQPPTVSTPNLVALLEDRLGGGVGFRDQVFGVEDMPEKLVALEARQEFRLRDEQAVLLCHFNLACHHATSIHDRTQIHRFGGANVGGAKLLKIPERKTSPKRISTSL